jgi:hypothetical protein
MILFERPDVVRAEHNKSQLAAFQVLLGFETFDPRV